jgi:uncharacterized protein
MYLRGIGHPIDKEKALTLIDKSSNLGNTDALIFMGIHAQETEGNYEKALKYFKLAMSQGHPESYFRIGKFHEEGLIFEQSFEKALEYFRMGEALEESNSLNSIGFFYENGIGGVEQSSQKAIQYYEKAAELGDANAFYNLGCIYIEGEMVEKDEKKSFDYFFEASELGSNGINFIFRIGKSNDIHWRILQNGMSC